jgi:hypothetical protein
LRIAKIKRENWLRELEASPSFENLKQSIGYEIPSLRVDIPFNEVIKATLRHLPQQFIQNIEICLDCISQDENICT